MSYVLTKILPAMLFWGIFIFVIFTVPYPQTLIQAEKSQLFSFFIPLFLGLTFSFNVFFKNLFLSVSVSLGIISLLILKALDTLNTVTTVLVIITSGLLISYFKKTKRSNLTKLPKIPKLTRLKKA